MTGPWASKALGTCLKVDRAVLGPESKTRVVSRTGSLGVPRMFCQRAWVLLPACSVTETGSKPQCLSETHAEPHSDNVRVRMVPSVPKLSVLSIKWG